MSHPDRLPDLFLDQVRCFCLSRQSLSGHDMAGRFLDNLEVITRACDEPGPFIYAVHTARIEQLVMSET